jgi:N-acetylglucosaminyl-diphospho-decaprenol L-rhamnosyltransferase
MSDRPEVSVVVVAHRARDLVLKCLESLERDAGMLHEAIVVDDGSGDGTGDAVRRAHPDVRLVEKPVNQGLAAGRNSALPLVRGRLVLMLDSDTEVTPGALAAMASVLDANPDVGLVGPKLIYPSGEVQPSCRRWPSFWIPVVRRWPINRIAPNSGPHRRHMMLDFDHASERPVVYVMGAAQMWRADLPGRIGSYDEGVSSYGGEDLDWCLRVWEAALEVRYAPQAVIVHDWQRVVHHRRAWNPHALRALRDFYYLQWKHRELRRDPRVLSLD